MIRYDEKLNREINRIVTNYNAKINRLNKKGISNIPSKLTKTKIEEIKKISKSRLELRRELKYYQRFSSRGGEKIINVNGTNIPRYQYETIKELTRLSKRRYNKQIKTLETTNKRGTQYKIAQLESVEMRNLKSRLNYVNKNIEDIENFNKYIETLFRNRSVTDPSIFLENYKKMLKDNFEIYGIDESIFKEINSYLNTLSGNRFYALYQSSSLMKEVLYAYGFIKDIQNEDDRKQYQEKFLKNIEELKNEIVSLS